MPKARQKIALCPEGARQVSPGQVRQSRLAALGNVAPNSDPALKGQEENRVGSRREEHAARKRFIDRFISARRNVLRRGGVSWNET